MAASVNSVCAVLFLILLGQGICQLQCSKDDLMIKQSKTGLVVESKPEFVVTVFNACPCLQGNVKFACSGFQTVKQVNPVMLRVNGDECLFFNGSLMAPFSGQSFTYAWDTQFPFKAISSNVNCN